MRLMTWPSLNDLEMLPSVYKAFFDLVVSRFSDMESHICFREEEEPVWMPRLSVHCCYFCDSSGDMLGTCQKRRACLG